MQVSEKLLREHPELQELLQVIRYALERCVPLIESKIVGIARYLGSKYIKRGKHIRKIVKDFPILIIRKGINYRLTEAGKELLAHVINHPYPFVPLQLRIIKTDSRIDIRYYLDGYFLERNDKKIVHTMKYNIKAIFLKEGEAIRTPIEANNAIAIVRYTDKSCPAVFNLDDQIKVESHPKLAYLFWYAATRLDAIKETNLKYIVGKFPHKVFRRIKRINQREALLWKLETPYGGVIICSKCISNKCAHATQYIATITQ